MAPDAGWAGGVIRMFFVSRLDIILVKHADIHYEWLYWAEINHETYLTSSSSSRNEVVNNTHEEKKS